MKVNNRPIIGILSQPCDNEMTDHETDQYIAAGYVKHLEGSGARVVPILYDSTPEEIETLFKSINGILLPGGGADHLDQLPQYCETLRLLYRLVIDANDRKDYFPLWGTCLGFEQLVMMQANDIHILEQFKASNYTIPLDFTDKVGNSRLFSLASPSIMQDLATLPLTMNNHKFGISPSTFTSNALLDSFFDILSNNLDQEGVAFVSTIEAKNYPIYGVQWHPEKPLYEWYHKLGVDHSYQSILVNQYTSNWFVNECRKNFHSFSDNVSETNALIYNYPAIHQPLTIPDFQQIYYFPCNSNIVVESCITSSSNSGYINQRPIIGILTQPTRNDGSSKSLGYDQYIAASYVKYIESAGARVVPILYDSTPKQLKTLFQSINGILLPGGAVLLQYYPLYQDTIRYLYQLVVEANDRQDYFPLWGTCLGFEQILMMQADNIYLMESFDALNYSLSLNFTRSARDSRLFSMAPESVMQDLATLSLTMNNHKFGISPSSFMSNPLLNHFFTILSINNDRGGLPFVSTIEAKDYPIYGVQWHPEKPLYEWTNTQDINHSYQSILANQYTANWFVNECRKNFHSFSDQSSEANALIYNYQATLSIKPKSEYQQIYYFKNQTLS
ncbi:hypothetical protein DFA_01284 [Cavenderia fasciculata]|uniref:folate gamma-glutamyl hydrolase n=1 Tax=Cavenderia fasciculata TaxID=261658 RepID=F4PRW6_CACFS|nr:uncharacterized protein DFA_01284 [Cavenderia fasciculata]EGG21402.1 hypothetical protein DFA_01284 [Cavenderia fasciculata]|eukprot:XP_004359252.1 hypothetical protein DFA_01284 [Cavenderia fasciculata]